MLTTKAAMATVVQAMAICVVDKVLARARYANAAKDSSYSPSGRTQPFHPHNRKEIY